MNEINIAIDGGTSKRLLTAGKYCDRDIIISANGGSLGNLTEYIQITAKPATTTSFVISNPLGGYAKKVSVKRTVNNATSSRKIQDYILDSDIGIGALYAIDTSGGARYVVKSATNANNGEFTISDGKITLYRFNSSNTWDTANDYTIEIWQ